MEAIGSKPHLDCLKDALEVIYKELKAIKTYPPTFFPTLISQKTPRISKPSFYLDLDQCIQDSKKVLKLSYESHYQAYIEVIENVRQFSLKHLAIDNQSKFDKIMKLLDQAFEIQKVEDEFSKVRKSVDEIIDEFANIQSENLYANVAKEKDKVSVTVFPMWQEQPLPAKDPQTRASEEEVKIVDNYMPPGSP